MIKQGQGITSLITDKDFYLIEIRSLTPWQATENVFAIAVQGFEGSSEKLARSLLLIAGYDLPVPVRTSNMGRRTS